MAAADSVSGFADTYSRQAASYDTTRSAGAETVRPLLDSLTRHPPGARVLDVGGGTGNYAAVMRQAGFRVTLMDRSPDMLRRARAKGIPAVLADATALPVGDSVVDAVTLISMLHQVPDWRAALAQARRALRTGGSLVLLLYTAEHLRDHYFLDYFPSTRSWIGTEHAPLATYLQALPGAIAQPLQIRHTDDLTMQVMRRHPTLALDARLRGQTSYFARLEQTAPAELALGIQRLADDIEHDRLPTGYADDLPQGDAVLIWWTKAADDPG